MENHLFYLLFLAALFHALWNTIIKTSKDPLLGMALLQIFMGGMCLPLLFFVPLLNKEAWPFLIASILLHTLYYTSLGLAYRKGPLSVVYPVSRGLSPLFILLLTSVFLEGQISLYGKLGILLVAIGIIISSFSTTKNLGKSFTQNELAITLLIAITIAFYSMADGLGARASNSAIHYIIWLFALDSWGFLFIMFIKYGKFWKNYTKKEICMVGVGSGLAMTSYSIAIYAMSIMHFAYVSAIRETSIVLATIIGIFYLKEEYGILRIASAIIVFIGVFLIYYN